MSAVPALVALAVPNDFLRGVVLGAALVAVPGGLWVVTLQVTGTAPTMMGEQAEQQTAAQLRGLGRVGWRLVNHVGFQTHDIDHVLIGPGGAYAVETKWTAGSWDATRARERLVAAAAQARANARTLRLWAPFKAAGIQVHPVLVLWGGSVDDDVPSTVESVPVVAGRDLRSWAAAQESGCLTSAQVAAGWSALDKHLRRRDPLEAAEHPLATSPVDWLARAAFTISAALLGFLLVAQLLTRSHSTAITVAVGLLTAVPALVAIRLRRATMVASGWLTGTAGSAIALLVTDALYRLH